MQLEPQHTISPQVQPRPIVIACNQTPHDRPACHGPLCTDENHAVLRQETTRTAFCNYLVSWVEALQEREFQMFKNEALKLLSGIQSRAEERTSPPQQLHFLGDPVPLPYICHRLVNNHTDQHKLPGNTSCIFPGNTSCKTQMPASQAIQLIQENQAVLRGQQ